MITLEQRIEVKERVEHFIDMGNAALSTDLNVPHVRFDKRGTCGGTAWYSKMELNFNAGLMVDNWDEYMNQVIPHEVAHLLKEHVYGCGKGRLAAHGFYWQRIMRELGVNPDRTHDMDTSKVAMPKAKYIYECQGCNEEFVLSSVRHNKMRRGKANYRHCKGHKLVHLKPLGKITTREAMDHRVPGIMKKRAQKAAPRTGTKIAHAIVIFKEMIKTTTNRQDIISALSHSMQITKAQAAGYYQSCKKRAA